MPGLLAFFKRTLREHSRSSALVIARTALAVTLLATLGIFQLNRSIFGAAGLDFFRYIITINALFISAGGCTYFASAIAEEKEDGTLALLRMSQVSSLSVLLGKGGSRMLDGALLLAVQIPFTLIGVTLGGITWGQVASAYATLASYLALVCALGLAAGVVARQMSQAVLLAALGVGALFVGSSILGTDEIFDRLWRITATNFDGPVFDGWCGRCLLGAFGLFVASWVSFDYFCSDSVASRARSEIRAFRDGLIIGRAPTGGAVPFDLIRWKDLHFLHTTPATSRKKLQAYLVIALLLSVDLLVRRQGLRMSYFCAFWGLRVLGCALLAIYCEWLLGTARAFSEEQRAHTLAPLMILPGQTASSLLHSKMRVIPALLREALIFVWVGVGLLMLGLVAESREALGFFITLPLLASIGIPLLWSQGLCLQRLVLHLSLRVRTGALPLAIGIWILGNLLVWLTMFLLGAVLTHFESLMGIFALVVPAAVVASMLREKNLALIEAAAGAD